MKKTKIANYLKTGILLVSVSLLLWNCEKEDVSLIETTNVNFERVKKVFATQFNKSAFPRIKNEPLWEKANVHFSEDGQYIEIPFREVKQEDLEKSTSMSLDHLVATVNSSGEVELNIVHYFAEDIKNTNPNFELLNYYDTDNFHGFITKYDLNKNVIAIDRFINGVKSENKFTINEKKKSDLLGKVDEECNVSSEIIRTEDCMFWYNPKTVDDPIKKGDVEIITCSYTTSVIYYNSCGGNSGNNTSSGGGVTVITNSTYFAINTENLDDCTKSIFNKIKESNSIENVISRFSGENSLFNWTLETKPESSFFNTANSAETGWTNGEPNSYTTKIGSNFKDSATDMSIARALVHEAIHAYILSYLDSDASSFTQTFPILFKNMVSKKYGIPNNNLERYHHEEVALNYVNSISEALADWDNNNHQPQFYKDLAWGGLYETDIFQETELISNTDRTRIYNVNNSENINDDNAKGKLCSDEDE